MRINKKLVKKGDDKGWFRNRSYYSDNPDYYVDVDKVAAATAWALTLASLFAIAWLLVFGLVHQHSTDIAKYNHICDEMAGNQRHYLGSSRTTNIQYACVIGPDWHRVDI